MNSFWMFWIGCLCGARLVSSFYDFWKITFWDFATFFSFLTQSNLCLLQMFILRSIKAYLCPNMINFDGVDFSECRSEEAISFFWHSVYFNKQHHNLYLPSNSSDSTLVEDYFKESQWPLTFDRMQLKYYTDWSFIKILEIIQEWNPFRSDLQHLHGNHCPWQVRQTCSCSNVPSIRLPITCRKKQNQTHLCQKGKK